MALLDDQFNETYDFPLYEGEPEKYLVIASNQRVGSHMVGQSLYHTKRFGAPLEYVNDLAGWQKRFKTSGLADTLSAIKRVRTSPNGVFSIKLHYAHVRIMGGFRDLQSYFPGAHFVLMSRKDVLRQAISLAIAIQTGEWIAGRTAVKEPEYSFHHINNCLRNCVANHASWRYTLAAHGCNSMELEFEAVRRDLVTAVRSIADFMDVDTPVDVIPVEAPTRKQTKPINAIWEERFLKDFDSQTLFPETLKGLSSFLAAKLRNLANRRRYS